MASEVRPLVGLAAVTHGLVDHLVSRPDGESRPLPVVVALGARGTGKTALLDTVAARCADIPHARLDFERHDRAGSRPRELLGQLAFDLSRQWKQFGRLAFPRLWLCMLVLGAPVELQDRRAALRKLHALVAKNQPLEQNREAIVDVVRLAGGIAPAGGLQGWPEATDLLLRGLSWYDRRRLVGKMRALPAGAGNHEDFLLEIAKRAQGDDEDREAVDATFCDAFLADLRRAYTGLNRSRRTLNSLVLLDNAHTEGGRLLLSALTEARRRSGEADPLVVLATSREWNPEWNESWSLLTPHRGAPEHRRPTTHRTSGLSWPAPRQPADVDGDWRPEPSRPDPRWHPWYLLELGTLSKDDVVALAAGREIHPASRLPGFLHRLTDGHPGAVTDVVAAVAHRYDPRRPGALRTALRTRLDDAGPDLLTAMRDYLLQDFTTASRPDLVTASAALDVEMLFHKEILDLRNPAGEGVLFKELGDHLWLRAEPAVSPQYVLHPLLRRILLQELASRADDHPLSWTRVHTRCRDFYEKNGRVVAARYHDLALENVAAAVAHLREPFGEAREFDLPTAETWLAELDVITAAPNRLAKAAEPYDQVQRHAGEGDDDLGTQLAWLVVALWIARDPLGDPGGTLDSTIEGGFHQLAQGRGRGSILLHERAERYR
ncbi:hypothetical protein M8542_18960 [Amycolatopsis sp. OK19-0408]|uniref:Uncharacterized protein n=1 Tax=Amycolatopsis iheyensis TaxID=2945988 RepID=A0A9X2SK99_9PSEU|nr:hypothetical protein [Amycolatopsis iheyensis]MCR6484913.1 hypothetical protein [Amycolatopsis iheyensis]